MSYYDDHAKEYFTTTSNPLPDSMYADFLSLLRPNGRILDIGCGSGRDIKYFVEHGFKADGIDQSSELCKLAREYTGQKIINADIRTWMTDEKYDAVWACASLLHLTEKEIIDFFHNINFLNNSSIIYASFKSGLTSKYDEKGRYFTNFTNTLLDKILENGQITLLKKTKNTDAFQRTGFEWVNLLFKYSTREG